MIRSALFLLAALVFASQRLHAAPRHFGNDEYRFSMEIPEGWEASDDFPFDDSDLLLVRKGGKSLLVQVFRAPEGRNFNLRRLLDTHVPKSGDCIGQPEYAPGYNLLRHTICFTRRGTDGLYLRQMLTFRARTLFILSAFNDSDDFSDFDPLFASVELHRSHWGNFLLAKSNLGAAPATLFLLLIPLTGAFTGARFRRWRHSGRTDRAALWLSIGGATLFIGTLALTFTLLHDDMVLAACVAAAAAIFWAFSASGDRFLRDIYGGIFG